MTVREVEASREERPRGLPLSRDMGAHRRSAAQHQVAIKVSESFIGRKIKVLVEGQANAKQLQNAKVSSWEHGLVREMESSKTLPAASNYFVGRGEADAPDIDGRVFIKGKLPVSEFARVKVVGHTDYDLIAEPMR